MSLLLLLLLLVAPFAVGGKEADGNCNASDANLLLLRETVCASLGGCPTGNVTAQGDWPSQAVYYNNLLVAMADGSTCERVRTCVCACLHIYLHYFFWAREILLANSILSHRCESLNANVLCLALLTQAGLAA